MAQIFQTDTDFGGLRRRFFLDVGGALRCYLSALRSSLHCAEAAVIVVDVAI